jgi:hypothetical protein
MQITGGFLAERAEIVDQKLNLIGGILDWIVVPKAGQFNEQGQRLVATYYMVTLMQASPDDHQKPFRLKTELVDPSGGTSVLIDQPIAFDSNFGENRFYVSQLNIAAPYGGRVTFIQTIDNGDPIAIPVELRVVEP